MLYIFDMDYTLLDTVRFKEGLAEAFGLGDLWADSYKTYFKEQNKGNANFKLCYNIEKHLDFLLRDGKIDIKQKTQIQKNIEKFWADLDKYLFPGVKQILETLNKKGNKLIFFSYGDKEHHLKKIQNLKIQNYFSKIILVDQNKEEALDFLKLSQEKIVIVNDNAKECMLMNNILPQAEIFLVDGPYSKNVEHNFKIRKLNDLLI